MKEEYEKHYQEQKGKPVQDEAEDEDEDEDEDEVEEDPDSPRALHGKLKKKKKADKKVDHVEDVFVPLALEYMKQCDAMVELYEMQLDVERDELALLTETYEQAAKYQMHGLMRKLAVDAADNEETFEASVNIFPNQNKTKGFASAHPVA